MRSICIAAIFAASLCAQKAEPLRIELHNGAATVEGRLRGRQQTEYETEVGASKTLTLQLTASPAKTIALKLYSPEGIEMPLRATGENRWTAQSPKQGDYGVSVLRKSLEPGASTYKLTIRIN